MHSIRVPFSPQWRTGERNVESSQSSKGRQSVSGRQGLVRIVTSVGGSSARLGGTDVYLDEDLPDSVDDNDNSDDDDDNDSVGIDEDNNVDDEAGEYVNTSRLCERPCRLPAPLVRLNYAFRLFLASPALPAHQ